MTGRSPAPSAFAALPFVREDALRRQTAILFDDPRLRPAPSPDDLLGGVAPTVVARYPADSPADPSLWVLTEVTRELLGRGWAIYDGPLRGMIGRKVWSDADVDELIQGAAAVSLRRLGELVSRPRPLFGWLCLLVRQERVDWLRRGRGRRGQSLTGEAVPDAADTGTTPTQAERLSRVRDMYSRVLASLSQDDSHLLRLATVEGRGPAEIAGLLGLSEGNARQRLFRARCAAARAWQELFPEAAAELAGFGVFPPGTAPT
jgi:RNA polymerase sigma factor (sigma-70 family)